MAHLRVSQVSNQGPPTKTRTNLGLLRHQGGEEPLDVLFPTQGLLVVQGLRVQSCNKKKMSFQMRKYMYGWKSVNGLNSFSFFCTLTQNLFVQKFKRENLLPVQNENSRTLIEWPANGCFSILLRSQQFKTFLDCENNFCPALDIFLLFSCGQSSVTSGPYVNDLRSIRWQN